MEKLLDTLRALAARWREQHSEHSGGIVLIWDGSPYGWKNALRDPNHERPGAYAVDEAGEVFAAEGGDAYNGALRWVQLSVTDKMRNSLHRY